MSKDVDMQVKDHLLNCDVISFAIDESTDINNIARLAIVARYGFINSSIIYMKNFVNLHLWQVQQKALIFLKN